MTHQEMTTHIRKRIKAAGIQAKCRMSTYCGIKGIQVNVPTFEARFTESEQREIRLIAKVNRLTGPHGADIDIERMTNSFEFNFEFHAGVN